MGNEFSKEGIWREKMSESNKYKRLVYLINKYCKVHHFDTDQVMGLFASCIVGTFKDQGYPPESFDIFVEQLKVIYRGEDATT